MEETSSTAYQGVFGEEAMLEVQPNAMGGYNLTVTTTKNSTGLEVLEAVRSALNDCYLHPAHTRAISEIEEDE